MASRTKSGWSTKRVDRLSCHDSPVSTPTAGSSHPVLGPGGSGMMATMLPGSSRPPAKWQITMTESTSGTGSPGGRNAAFASTTCGKRTTGSLLTRPRLSAGEDPCSPPSCPVTLITCSNPACSTSASVVSGTISIFFMLVVKLSIDSSIEGSDWVTSSPLPGCSLRTAY